MEIPQRYEAAYRVRFDEAGADGLLPPSGLLRYAQDIAWRHSEIAGFDRDWYRARGSHWLVRHVRIQPNTPVSYGDELGVTTEVTGWRRVWARRHTEFRLGEGALVAVVETDWVLLTTAGRPTRIPEEIMTVLAPGQSFTPGRVALRAASPDAIQVERAVRAVDVDPLGHLNNAAYVDLVDEALSALDGEAGGTDYRLEYVRPALPGMMLRLLAWRSRDDSVACRMLADDGQELSRALVSLRSAASPRNDRRR